MKDFASSAPFLHVLLLVCIKSTEQWTELKAKKNQIATPKAVFYQYSMNQPNN